jgi:hypothetical protein
MNNNVRLEAFTLSGKAHITARAVHWLLLSPNGWSA